MEHTEDYEPGMAIMTLVLGFSKRMVGMGIKAACSGSKRRTHGPPPELAAQPVDLPDGRQLNTDLLLVLEGASPLPEPKS